MLRLAPPSTQALAATRTSKLALEPDMSFEEWAAVGRRIARIRSGAAWALGDWLVFGERRFGDRYRSALEATDLDYQTLRNYAWVARAFEPARRHDALSFQHHAEVASLAPVEQDLWLHRAEDQGWSRNALRRRLAAQRADRQGNEETAPLVVRVEVPSEHARRWHDAAAAAGQPLPEWLRAVADAAAEATAAGR